MDIIRCFQLRVSCFPFLSITMDQYQQLATLLLRCFTQKLDDYRISASKEDNIIYLMQETCVVEFAPYLEEYPPGTEYFGTFSIARCLKNVRRLGVCGTIDYIICTKCREAENSLPETYSPDLFLTSLRKVNGDNSTSINLYVSDSLSLNFDHELRDFCEQHAIDLVNSLAVAQDFCQYLENNILFLTPKDVVGTLHYLCLRQYGYELNFDECRYNKSWDDVSNKQQLIIVESSCEEFLKRHTVGGIVRRTKSKCDLNNVYKNLWLSNEVSLLLRVDSLEDFQNFVNISETFGVEVRVTIASNCLEVIEKGVCTRSLMNFDVSVQGRFTIKLGDILGETFNYSDVIRVVSERAVNFHPLPKYFVERSFLKVILSLDALKELNDEFFVVRSKVDNGNELLKGLVKQELKNVHVVDNDEEFELEVPRHYVNFYGENWVEWKKSSGDVENLRAYDISSDVNERFKLSELIQEEREAVVICGGAGMGKSVLLHSIANALPRNCWIEMVDLCKNPYPVSNDLVFRYLVAQKRAHVLIDGFDEASGELQSWLDLGCKVWMVARPTNARVLENRLKTISVELKPFNEQNRRDFLIRYFGEDVFASELFKILGNVFGDFMQNPLHMRIVAGCFDEHYRKFKFSGVLNLEVCPDVLEAFIQTRTDLLCARYGEKIQAFVNNLTLWALTVIFEKNDLVHLQTEQLCFDESLSILTSEALVQGGRFKHVIFDEYLAAKWIFTNLANEDRRIKLTLRILLHLRFSHLMRFGGVFAMLDRILAKGCELHLSLIQRKAYMVQLQYETILFRTLDAGGRTLAHIAALYGKHHPQIIGNAAVDLEDHMVSIIRLCENECITAEDTLLRYNAMDYALVSGTLAVANAICERLPNISTTVSLNNNDLETYFDYCTKVDAYKHLYKYLLKYTMMRSLVQNKILLNCTVDNFVADLEFNEILHDLLLGYIQTLEASLIVHVLEAMQLKTPDSNTYADLLLACAYGTTQNIEDLIIQGVPQSRLRFLTPLHVAVIHKRKDVVDLLLSFGANINAKDLDRNSPLHIACRIHSNVPIIEQLLQRDAVSDLTNADGDTPLHCALKANLPNVARMFLPTKQLEMLLSGNYSRLVDLNVQNNDGDTPLLLAIKHGHNLLVRELLQNHVNVSIVNNSLNSCLHNAAERSNGAVFKELIYRHPYVNERNENGETPLLVALNYGRTEVVQVLMTIGADVNVSDKDFMSCLHHAVTWGRPQIIKDLLERGANINQKNKDGVSVLMHAIINDQSNVAILLIRRGADVNAVDNVGSSALHHAALSWKHHVIRELVSHGAQIDKLNDDGDTPLLIALKNSHVTCVKTLLSLGADASICDKNGSTCLHLSLVQHLDILHQFLAVIDVNCVDSEGNTPLLISLRHSSSIVTRFLLDFGADIFATNKSGLSSLHYAAKTCSEVFLTEFIARGADVNQKTKSGDTPLLIHLMENSRRSVVKILIDTGADVNAVCVATGNSCLHYAVDNRDDDVIGDLVRAGAVVNMQNRNGETPLHSAIRFGSISLVRLLLGSGADPNIADRINGSTCLHWAVTVNEDDYVKALVEHGADINKENNDGETPLNRARRFGYDILERMMTKTDDGFKQFDNLCEAVKRGAIFTVKKLLENDFDIDKKNENGETLLMIALENCEVGVADYLITRGASLNLTNNRGYSSLHSAASVGDVVNVRRHLDSGVDIDIADINGDTPLITACFSNNRNVVKLLLERKARVELSPMNNPKQTCLHYAVEGCWDDIVSQILDTGFFVDKRNARGSTALMRAISFKNPHIARLLLDRGADPFATDESRATCLHIAVSEGMIDIVEELVKIGICVNERDSGLNTPLLSAIECEYRAVTKFLLSVPEVDVHVENSWCSPLHQAAYVGLNEAVLEIIERGFDIDKENVNGDAPLFVAFVGRRNDTSRFLWKKGARIDIVNSITKCTCLNAAVGNGCEDVVREILALGCFSVVDLRTDSSSTSIASYINVSKILLESFMSLEQLDDNYELLHLAAAHGDFAIMSALLERGLNINVPNKNGETPLLVALREHRWVIAELLLSRGADVNTIGNEYGRTCLHYVADSAEDKLMTLLIERGCDVNAQQYNGYTALMDAIRSGMYAMVKILLDNGADPNIADDYYGMTAFHWAASSNRKIMLDVIAKVEDLDKRSKDDETALYLSIQSHYDLARIILEHGATDFTGKDGNTCLHYVAENGVVDLTKLLVDKMIKVDCVNDEGNTPLMLAIKHEQKEVVQLLLERGADVRLLNNDGNSCIHLASSTSEQLALIVDKGDVNGKNNSGQTPLLIAISGGHTENVTILLEKGANVFAEDIGGNTCLHLAAACGDDDALMQTLLTKGLDVNKKNNDGDSCLQVAIENSSTKVVKMLLGMGGDPTTVSSSGRTSLLCAIENGDEELWTQLLSQNVDVNVQTNSQVTPLFAAIEMGRADLAKQIIAMGCDVNVRKRSGSYLHSAAELQVDVIGELFAAGLDVDQQNNDGYTPLSVALKFKNVDAAIALLDLGADPNLNNNDGIPCLHHAVAFHREDIVLRLLGEGLSINVRSSCGNTPLLYALQHQRLDNAKLLLAHGAAIDVLNNKGNSCLYYASKAGFNDLVEELIEKGHEIDKFNYRDFTPFLAALSNSQLSTAKLLLKKGANPTVRGRWDITPLDFIIASDDVELAEMASQKGIDIDDGLRRAFAMNNKIMTDFFIEKGADLRSIDYCDEESCLHLGARAGFDDIVAYLIDEGLDINRRNNSRETPLRVAFANSKFTTAKLLLSRGAITPPESFNYSYLHYAAEEGDVDLTLEFIARGLNLECKSDSGYTPLFLAVKKGQINTAKVLLEHGADVYGLSSEGHNLLHYAKEANADDIKALLLEKGLVDDS
ncbi:hypothetical protein FQR65_LT14530 [Abscondita terminalis]|nr:hypothetical protein FQR65_LT14530 [Abscondita terminalis]